MKLNYKEYKALIGDNGVTKWVKFNWLSNNEIKKYLRVALSNLTWTRGLITSTGEYRWRADNIPNLPGYEASLTPVMVANKVLKVLPQDLYKVRENDLSITTSTGNGTLLMRWDAITDPNELRQALLGIYITYKKAPLTLKATIQKKVEEEDEES